MSTLCVLFCDGLQARVYRTLWPPAQFPTELTLGYQQVNFGGLMSEFVMSLCRMIRSDFKAGKFNDLVVIAPDAIGKAFDKYLAEDCHSSLKAVITRNSGPSPDKKDLLAELHSLLEDDIFATKSSLAQGGAGS